MDQMLSSATTKNRLGLYLKPIFIGQLMLLDYLSQPAYGFEDGLFIEVLERDDTVTSEFISHYAKKFGANIFLHEIDYLAVQSKVKQEITKLSRSLSIGSPERNATKQANLLSMQMDSLYKDPMNDELLASQFQNSNNLGSMLLGHKGIHKGLYHNLSKSNYHYTIKQPLLSSVMLLSFTQSLGGFNEKEIQNLFVVSYFKDIGMAFIPNANFEKEKLSEFDKNLFSDHASNSMKILDNRVPLNPTQLNMIKNHHYMNFKIQGLINNNEIVDHNSSSEFLTGIESALLSGLDILVAMTNDRPYRTTASMFEALELLKKILSNDYPQEFKALVIFLKKFYAT